jgi:hypothetical protein
VLGRGHRHDQYGTPEARQPLCGTSISSYSTPCTLGCCHAISGNQGGFALLDRLPPIASGQIVYKTHGRTPPCNWHHTFILAGMPVRALRMHLPLLCSCPCMQILYSCSRAVKRTLLAIQVQLTTCRQYMTSYRGHPTHPLAASDKPCSLTLDSCARHSPAKQFTIQHITLQEVTDMCSLLQLSHACGQKLLWTHRTTAAQLQPGRCHRHLLHPTGERTGKRHTAPQYAKCPTANSSLKPHATKHAASNNSGVANNRRGSPTN